MYVRMYVYMHWANWAGGEISGPEISLYLIPAGQEIANKILVSAREINPSHATVEASLRIIARRPPPPPFPFPLAA